MKLAILILPLALCGCKLTKFSQTMPDGRIVRATDMRLFSTTTADIECVFNPTNGVVLLKVKVASKGDVDMIKAVAEGAVKGAVAGAKP